MSNIRTFTTELNGLYVTASLYSKHLSTGSHSHLVFATFIIGDTPFPEFSALVMLDDVQVGYYDSHVNKIIYKHSNSKHGREQQEDASLLLGVMHKAMRERTFYLRQQLNSTHGNYIRLPLKLNLICHIVHQQAIFNPNLEESSIVYYFVVICVS